MNTVDTTHTFTCDRCASTNAINVSGASGYANTDKGETICYQCCADDDRDYMLKHGKIALYDTNWGPTGTNLGSVSNWCGTLEIPIVRRSRSSHNIARYRYDVWFKYNGHVWHGVRYGDNTQIVHCKATLERSY